MSGVHDVFGNAVDTTNGAGPHNIQIFMLAADGTVLNVLPGYWNPKDLVIEMNLAAQLNKVWLDKSFTRAEKDRIFQDMHIAHTLEHPPDMVLRSRMQSFDIEYESRKAHSDAVRAPQVVQSWHAAGLHAPAQAFKTTDVLMHDRMAQHGFQNYENFDVARFCDYGQPRYDKHEDYIDAKGAFNHEKAAYAPTLGSAHQEHGAKAEHRRELQEQPNNSNWESSNQTWGSGNQ